MKTNLTKAIDQINAHILAGRGTPGNTWNTAAAITCASGLKLSVQGSASHYCSPKNNVGPYHMVEVLPEYDTGDFDALVEKHAAYMFRRQGSRPVLGWVRIREVAEVVIDNGGLALLTP